MIPCSHLSFINWLQDHLIPCPFKALTGIDCPGCGFQRSILALIQGDIAKSIYLYPATILLLATGIFTIANARLNLDPKKYIRRTLYISTATIIAVAYAVKISR